VQLLLYSGFDPKQKDRFGQTPLHLACLSGDLVTVEHIVDMVGIDYLHQLHPLYLKTVCTILFFNYEE